MALRAGYYGLKNSVKKTLEKLASDLAGAKIIKSVGDGLSLSDQGALAANIDSETMEFKDHKLAAKIPSYPSYSTTEFNTGKKWIDGKDIFGIVAQPTDKPVSTSWVNLGASGIGADVAEMMITIRAMMSDADSNEFFPVPDGTLDLSFNKTTDVMYVKSLAGAWDHSPKWVYLEYTKKTPEPEPSNNTRKKKS